MASSDIQIVNISNLEKIESFFNDTAYKELLENSENYNSRLRIERLLRGGGRVAQNHCSLFMDRRQRMPGFREGQIYSYPAQRWRKSRRQYLTKIFRPFGGLTAATPLVNKRFDGPTETEPDFNGASFLEESSSLGGADTSDSKDSQNLKEDLPKEWFYDDMDINEIDALDEPKSPADDEYDYDPRYGNKKRKKRKPGRKATTPHHHVGDGPRKGRPPGGGRGRGRRKNLNSSRSILEPPSPTPISEPPSFETAAAAVEDSSSSDLRSYRKYL